MAGKTAILSVRILGDAKGAVDAMGKAEGRAGKLGSALKGIGGIALGAATVAGGALVGPASPASRQQATSSSPSARSIPCSRAAPTRCTHSPTPPRRTWA